MAPVGVVWVIDTSSIIEVRRAVQVAVRRQAFAGMSRLVLEERLVYPPEVLNELERNNRPQGARRTVPVVQGECGDSTWPCDERPR